MLGSSSSADALPRFVDHVRNFSSASRSQETKEEEGALLEEILDFNALRLLGTDARAARWQRDDWAALVDELLRSGDLLAAEMSVCFEGDDDVEDDELECTRIELGRARHRMSALVVDTWRRWKDEMAQIDGASREHLEIFDRDLASFLRATRLPDVEGEPTLSALADGLYETLGRKFMQTMGMEETLYVVPRRAETPLPTSCGALVAFFDAVRSDSTAGPVYKEEMMQLRDILLSDAPDRAERAGSLLELWTHWYDDADNFAQIDSTTAARLAKSVERSIHIAFDAGRPVDGDALASLRLAISRAVDRRASLDALLTPRVDKEALAGAIARVGTFPVAFRSLPQVESALREARARLAQKTRSDLRARVDRVASTRDVTNEAAETMKRELERARQTLTASGDATLLNAAEQQLDRIKRQRLHGKGTLSLGRDKIRRSTKMME